MSHREASAPDPTPAAPRLGLLRAQWRVLRKRPLVLVLLGTYSGLLLLQMFAPVALLRLAPRLGNALNQDAAAALEQSIRLPSAFATIFGHINGIGGLLLMIIGGAFVGGDYGWGTQRSLLARQPGRGRYLAAKGGALALLAAGLVAISVPLGMACAGLAGAMLGLPQSLSPADGLLVLRGMLIAWAGLLPYIALSVFWAVIGRGAAAGIAGSLGYWLLEIGFGVASILQALGGVGERLYNFTLAQSVGAWTDLTRRAFSVDLGRAFGQFGFSFPGLIQASVMIAAYSTIFVGGAWWGLRKNIAIKN